MNLKTIKEAPQEVDIKKLCVYLTLVAANSKDRVEGLRELVESEFITEEFYLRFIEGEKSLLLTEIQNYIDIFKGIN